MTQRSGVRAADGVICVIPGPGVDGRPISGVLRYPGVCPPSMRGVPWYPGVRVPGVPDRSGVPDAGGVACGED